MSKKDTVAKVKGFMAEYAKSEKGSGVKITNKLAEEAYDAVVESFKSDIVEFGQAKVSGLGNFNVVKLNAGTKRNPDTGESVQVAERKTVRWAVSKVFRFTDAVQNAPVVEKAEKEDSSDEE